MPANRLRSAALLAGALFAVAQLGAPVARADDRASLLKQHGGGTLRL